MSGEAKMAEALKYPDRAVRDAAARTIEDVVCRTHDKTFLRNMEAALTALSRGASSPSKRHATELLGLVQSRRVR